MVCGVRCCTLGAGGTVTVMRGAGAGLAAVVVRVRGAVVLGTLVFGAAVFGAAACGAIAFGRVAVVAGGVAAVVSCVAVEVVASGSAFGSG